MVVATRAEPLFLALNRPALIKGVPLEGFVLNIVITFFAGMELSGHTLWRSPMMFWLAGIPIHMALQRLTAWDYHWMRTIQLWAMTVGSPVLMNRPYGKVRSPRLAMWG